ncbi:MAG TPA: molybdopterin cofactor-binding domain-containing protein [Steroidobacteraceae bacterium]
MSAPADAALTRRAVLQGSGALLVSFSVGWARPAQGAGAGAGAAKLPGSLAKSPLLDAWIRIDADGFATAFTGKAELGQGIRTALSQVVAEELQLPLERVRLVTADTGRTANEGYTAGSHSMQDSGTALRHAAAQAREILIDEAARIWKLPAQQLRTQSGVVMGPDGLRATYAEIVAPNLLHVTARSISQLTQPDQFRVLGRPLQRIDIPAKVTGGAAYVHDMRLPGMLHARIVRPPRHGARLIEAPLQAVERMPGVAQVIRNGNFLAVVAQREFQTIKAMQVLAAGARWQPTAALPDEAHLADTLLGLPAQTRVISQNTGAACGPMQLEATYTRPYLSHGSIGPSCAIAQLTEGMLTVWTHTQGVFPDRQAIAEMLGLPVEKVRCIQVEGSGCYGHNGADDAAADAALLASALANRPVRVQWMREQEHGCEPYGPAMVAKVSACLTGGRICAWNYDVWSNTHSMRPGPAGALLAARQLGKPFLEPEPKLIPLPEGGGDRNAIPLYSFGSSKVVHHFIHDMPLRVSALRSLGAHMNVFAIESFMDELALRAAVDPVEWRLRHLQEPRAREVITAAADEFNWAARPSPGGGRGCGFAFAQYKNLAAYCAVAMEVDVDADTGRTQVRRVACAVDTGQVVNPDGVRNQIEGAVLQSMSWTLFERVRFDATQITSVDWATYPILRFSAVPHALTVRILDRPGLPFLGCGEAGQGPAAAALANAIAHATGRRFRDLPLDPARLRRALAPQLTAR